MTNNNDKTLIFHSLSLSDWAALKWTGVYFLTPFSVNHLHQSLGLSYSL